MLTINSIKNGIVIDHIASGTGIKIYNYLHLNQVDFPVALITNVDSKKNKNGKKDMIKIENVMDIDYTELGLIDPNVTIDIIENEALKKKIKPELPAKVENVIKCRNPRCVTAVEKYVPHVFYLVDSEKGQYRCKYCDELGQW